MILQRLVKSLDLELSKWFYKLDMASTSKQAFSKARYKLRHTAFIELNKEYVTDFYAEAGCDQIKLYEDKYLLLAVDGSLLQLPESKSLKEVYEPWKNHTDKGILMGRASVVYDVLNELTWEAQMIPYATGENTIFTSQYDAISEAKSYDKASIVYLLDRGYPSYDLFCRIEANGDGFVARCKQAHNASIAAFAESGQTQGEVVFRVNSYYDDQGIKHQSSFTKPLTVHIFRFELTSGETEFVVTNLDLKADQVYQLYGLRWGVETYYDYVKGHLQLENFSAPTPEGVLQDFHATILLGNMAKVLIAETQYELDQEQMNDQTETWQDRTPSQKAIRPIRHREANTYYYQINQKTALGLLKEPLMELMFDESKEATTEFDKLKKLLIRSKVAVQPDRHYQRHKLKRSKRKHHRNKLSPL